MKSVRSVPRGEVTWGTGSSMLISPLDGVGVMESLESCLLMLLLKRELDKWLLVLLLLRLKHNSLSQYLINYTQYQPLLVILTNLFYYNF